MQNFLNTLVAQTDWAILLMRLALGVIFLIHGWNKAKNFAATTEWFGKIGFKPASIWAALAAITQLGGALLILFGFFAHIACLVLAVEMLIAMASNLQRKQPFFRILELNILLIAALLLLATLGSGPFSIG